MSPDRGGDVASGWHLAAYLPKTPERAQHEFAALRELTVGEFEAFEVAAREVIAFLQVEPFALLSANYSSFIDYRNDVMALIADQPQHAWPHPFAMGRELRREFFNWLLSVRIFLKHTESRLIRKFGDSSAEYASFKNEASERYESDFSYRFIDRLRNYAEHSGMPPLEGRIEGALETGGRVRELRLWFDRDELLARFNKWGRVKQEIEAQESEFPAELHMDRMMHHLGRIQEVARATEVNHLEDGVDLLEGLIREVQAVGGTPQLVRLHDDDSGMALKVFPLVTREALGLRPSG